MASETIRASTWKSKLGTLVLRAGFLIEHSSASSDGPFVGLTVAASLLAETTGVRISKALSVGYMGVKELST